MHEALACVAKPIKRNCLPDLHQGLYQVELRRMSKRGSPPWQTVLKGTGCKIMEPLLANQGDTTPLQLMPRRGPDLLVSIFCVVLASKPAKLLKLVLLKVPSGVASIASIANFRGNPSSGGVSAASRGTLVRNIEKWVWPARVVCRPTFIKSACILPVIRDLWVEG